MTHLVVDHDDLWNEADKLFPDALEKDKHKIVDLVSYYIQQTMEKINKDPDHFAPLWNWNNDQRTLLQ